MYYMINILIIVIFLHVSTNCVARLGLSHVLLLRIDSYAFVYMEKVANLEPRACKKFTQTRD